MERKGSSVNYDIAIKQVSVQYGSTRALNNISLQLPYGKIYGLLGRNGAGKTTFLSLIGSFMEPTSGEITVGGQTAFENAEVMPHVGFFYESDFKEESETVEGLFEVAERYRPNFDRSYAEELANKFGLPLKKRMKELSKGQQSAANVTLGLANRTPITIFDEAYLGMDAPTRERFYRELLEDHERHPRTIILSTHHVSEIDYLFEEVIILHEGNLLLQEGIDTLLERGVSITGAAQAVDEFVSGMHVLHTERLGGVQKSMVYGTLNDQKLAAAKQMGLEIGTISLQQLFIHLTEGGNADGLR